MVAFRSNTAEITELPWVLLIWHGATHLLWLRLQREMAPFLTAGALMAFLFPLPAAQTRVLPSKWLSMFMLRLSTEVRILFDIQFKWGLNLFKKENVYLTGSIDALKNWSPDKALALSYTENSIWTSKYTHTLFQVLLFWILFSQSPLRYPQTPTSNTNTFASSMVTSPGSQTQIILKQLLHQVLIPLMIPGGNTRSFLFCYFSSFFRWLGTAFPKILSLLEVLNPFNIWLAGEVRGMLWSPPKILKAGHLEFCLPSGR